MSVLWLGEPAAGDPARVGAKSARLSVLSTRFSVPAGFCLPVECCRPPALDPASGRLGPEARAVVAAAYDALGELRGEKRPRVVVRSSALGEDAPEASYAGQFDSIVNVVGRRAVVAAVEAVLSSALSERAMSYRRHGPDPAPVAGGLAVLVQELVDAEVSAVAFTADPITADRGTIVIEACWGLGPGLAEGRLQPDLYRLRRRDLRVESATPGDKRRMVVPAARGLRDVRVPALQRLRAVLEPRQMREVARMALLVEESSGWPVDIECAIGDGTLHLLQCRPVTALRS